MAYLGNNPSTQSFISGTDYFSGTGSQTTFTLTRTVNSVNDIEVVINNVVQQPSTAYTLSGTTITFTSAPSSGTNNIYVRYLATNMQSFTVPANSIGRNQLDSNLQAGFQGRNRIINGHMVVDQRNAGASVSNIADSQYTLDRWTFQTNIGNKYTVQQNAGSVTPPAGFTNYLGITSTSAYTVGSTEFCAVVQRIEGYNVADFDFGTANAKTITASFWVRSSLTGTFGGTVSNDNQDRTYPFSYSINSANTWEQKSITISGDITGTWLKTNGNGLVLRFGLGCGATRSGTIGSWTTSLVLSATGATSVVGTSGATFYITGVQLEEGTTATSFEREAYSVTLQKCQRYYFKNAVSDAYGWYGSGVVTNGNDARIGIALQQPMRSTPTMSIGGNTRIYDGGFATGATSASINNNSTIYIQLDVAVASGLTIGRGAFFGSNNDASGYLAFSAEL